MAGKQKQIYFQEADMDVLAHIEQQANQSQYIIRLIRDEMQKPKGLTWGELNRKLQAIMEE